MILYYANNKDSFDMDSYNEFSKDFWINNAKVVEYKEKWGNVMNSLIDACKLNNRHHVWSENHPCVLVI